LNQFIKKVAGSGRTGHADKLYDNLCQSFFLAIFREIGEILGTGPSAEFTVFEVRFSSISTIMYRYVE
jgi:hypothetical protein